jgi:hypothetical protein
VGSGTDGSAELPPFPDEQPSTQLTKDPFMTAKYRWDKTGNCIKSGRSLAADSVPGMHEKPRFRKSAVACSASLVRLIVLAFLCATSVHAAAPRYQVIDLGSLGGPNYYAWFTGVACRLLNNNGTVVGGMETSIPDPFCFNGGACLTSHAFEWTNSTPADLGTLEHNDAGNWSQASWINDQDVIVGVATYNAIGGSGEPLFKAVMWTNG